MLLKDKAVLTKAQHDINYLNNLLATTEANKFIRYVIKSYTKSPANFMAVNRVEWEDLQQAGYLGLYLGITRLNLSLVPNEWVRYLYLSVQGEIRKFSRSNDSNMVVIPQRIRGLYSKYRNFHEDFWLEHFRDPKIVEVMSHFNIDEQDAFDLVYGMQASISRDQLLAELYSSNHNFSDLDPTYHGKVENQAINKILVEDALKYVNEKQKTVLYLYYYKGLSKTEISKVIGCGNSMITKHINTAFKNIREQYGELA
ncbi:sigma-70 family RNA polymerase sigma factor [Niallia oryzisoli]|uniref:Sigma-70 family RNA polymerase sigma factor n=1 Tax=Niallia oryzisoli TaxID=1737571 RepID=A0ABZ2CJK1_9BACI